MNRKFQIRYLESAGWMLILPDGIIRIRCATFVDALRAMDKAICEAWAKYVFN